MGSRRGDLLYRSVYRGATAIEEIPMIGPRGLWWMSYRRARSQSRRWGFVRVSEIDLYRQYDLLAARCLGISAWDGQGKLVWKPTG